MGELDEMQAHALTTELTAYEEATRNNNEAHKRMEETKEVLLNDVVDISDTMLIAFEKKAESIKKLRDWRATIERESKLVDISIAKITDKITPEKIKFLREYVELIERLNSIEENPLVTSLLTNKEAL